VLSLTCRKLLLVISFDTIGRLKYDVLRVCETSALDDSSWELTSVPTLRKVDAVVVLSVRPASLVVSLVAVVLSAATDS